MHNELFSIGSITVHGYGLMIGIGALIAILISERRCKKNGLDGDRAFYMCIGGLIAGLFGAKLGHIISHFDEFLANPKEVLGTEGYVVTFGVLCGFLVGWLIIKRADESPLYYIDITFPQVSFAQSFGRIGCFLAGCCYGKPTDAWFGITFPYDSLAPSGVSLIPTQLISSAGDMLIFFVLWRLSTRKEIAVGSVACYYFMVYGFCRFFMEFIRDDVRTTIGIFTGTQVLCIALVAVGAAALTFLKKKQPFGMKKYI